MYGLMGLMFLGVAVGASKEGGLRGLFGLGSLVRDAVDAVPGRWPGDTMKQVSAGPYTFMFEIAYRNGAPNPQGYINAWVMGGSWPGYDKASEMYHNGEWKKLIAAALKIPVGFVHLGFGQDEFDVRPF